VSILVIGRSGQLARALARRAAVSGVELDTIGRPDLDLERPEAVAHAIAQRRPRVVINAAAYTAVDDAEDYADRARQINAIGPELAARAAADVGAAFIQVSTDYVFDGAKAEPYLETDQPNPISVYGASKLEGERLTLAANPKTIVVRTAWVYDATGQNFVRTMLRLAGSNAEIGVVDDQLGSPTLADDLAEAVLTIAETPDAFGVFHCVGDGGVSRAHFAEEIFVQSRERGGPSAVVKHVSTASRPTRAQRPLNSQLETAKLANAYGIRLRPWRDALSACMDEIATQWGRT
jgi:dTDP-4-dehydrorhamnose reductase